MNKQQVRSLLVIIGLLVGVLFVTTPTFAAPTGLSGSYNIGGSFPDFGNITLAVSTLNTQGISGNVTFRVATALFNEQVTIDDFPRDPGAENATVTFKADINGFPPTWQYSAAGLSNNWIVKLDGAHHIIFDEILFLSASPAPYARHIVFEGGAHDITVRDSSFTGHLGNDSIHNSMIYRGEVGEHNNITIENNTFTYGRRAIEWGGPGGGLSSRNLTVTGNSFGGQLDAGVYLAATESAVVDNNTVNSSTWSDDLFVGIYVAPSLSDTDPTALVVTNNDVDIYFGWTGIWVNGGGTAVGGIQNIIANNEVAVRDSTNGERGIYTAASYVGIYHNTVRTTGSVAVPLLNSSFFDYSNIDIRNNIFSAEGGAYAMQVNDHDTFDSDYNNLYTTGANVVFMGGTAYASLEDYQVATPFSEDDFSVSVPTTFVNIVNTNDLHLAAPSTSDVALLAPPLNDYPTDIDGDTRGTNHVYKGADEGNIIQPLDNADTLAGFYTVAGSTPDYNNISDAIFDLNQRGVKGDVTFRIRPGTYDVHELIDFPQFGGTYTVTLRSSSLISRPTLRHAADNNNDNYVLKLNDTNHVRIRGLDFEATGGGVYGRLLHLDGISSDTLVDQCIFTGLTGTTDANAALIYTYTDVNLGFDDEGQERNIFDNNSFVNGSYGIYQTGVNFSGNGINTEITDSTFSEQTIAAVSSTDDRMVISGNEIVSSHSDVKGLDLRYNKGVEILDNSIDTPSSGAIAIYALASDGRSFANPGLIVNNFIRGDSGVRFENSSSLWNIYHNTIRANGDALYINPDTSISIDVVFNIVNNILRSYGSGLAMSIEDPTTVDVVDFNNMRTAAANYVHWDGTTYNGLAAYQAASGLDEHSNNRIVTFVDPTNHDLHLAGTSDGDSGLAGTPLSSVPNDIDGDVRSLAVPYMGADEATPLASPTAIGSSEQWTVNSNQWLWLLFVGLGWVTKWVWFRPKPET